VNREEQTQRNLELFHVFMEQALDTPSLRDSVPKDADLIFLPEDDEELRLVNLKLAKRLEAAGKKPIFLKVSYVPKIELVEIA
jgi:hypothetical protein